jgi:hypothetical protein
VLCIVNEIRKMMVATATTVVLSDKEIRHDKED